MLFRERESTMNRANAQQQSTQHSVASNAAQTRLNGSWLLITRIVWLMLVIPSLGLFLFGLPTYYVQIQKPCVDATTCNIAGAMTAKGLQSLAMLGFSALGYATFYTLFWTIIVIIWSGIGFLIFLRRSDDWFALLTALFLVLFNLLPTTSALSISYPGLMLPLFLMGLVGQTAQWLFLLLFPNRRLVPRWLGAFIPFALLQAILFVAPPTWSLSMNTVPGWVNGLLALIVYVGVIATQVYRYRRISNVLERQQTKWVAFGISIVAFASFLYGFLFTTVFPVVDQPDSPYSLFQLVYPLTLLLIPLSIGAAILRYRLWDIDIIINRTLVYGLLTAFVVGFYILVVGYLGAIFRAEGNVLISLIATGLVAVLFQPLRHLLQRAVNRLVYGLRDEPYVVLSRLGQHLRTTLEPDAILSAIVATVREALKLSYTAIEVPEGASFALAAVSGTPPSQEAMRLPLLHQGEAVGTLLIAPRGHDDILTPADLRLLDDLTHQIGNAVHTVRLTSDLRELTRDLQRSREKLVAAREEERRRLRRDLHDGLGPMLSAVMLKVGLVRTLYRRDPQSTNTLLNQLEEEIELVIDDIRRLVYNLRPPALDDLGLLGAIREYVARLSTGEQERSAALKVTVEVPASLPPLPAAVEVAAYRIVQEAVTNVIRHAHAQSCCVRFLLDDAFQIEVSDDGKGFERTERVGIGLTSMRERAEELGGTFTIDKAASGGTVIRARLPLAADVRTRVQL
ncbi:MAG: hypothetical protein NVSMB27_30530 [Ktedonobacteraceae bacterium]